MNRLAAPLRPRLPPRRVRVPVGLALCIIVAAAPPATGQAVRGVVIDAATSRPIEGVALELLGAAGARVGTALSDSIGAFRMEAPTAGRYRLRAQRLGYATTETELFDVPPADEVAVRVALGVDAVPLEALRVVTTPRVPLTPQLADFYERRKLGLGEFLTRDEIAARGSPKLAELLEGMPGVRVVYTSVDVPILQFGRSANTEALRAGASRRPRTGAMAGAEDAFEAENTCPVVVIVDGNVWAPRRLAGNLDFYRQFFLLHPGDIEGIEVYRGLSELPGIFASPEAQRCGAVAVWLRRNQAP